MLMTSFFKHAETRFRTAVKKPGVARKTFVYGLMCKATGKWYVGQSADPARRFKEHARKPPRLMAADIDPGVEFRDQVEMQVLAEAATRDEADALEQHFTAQKQSRQHLGGYNVLYGSPAKTRQYYAIQASKKKRRAA